MVNRAVLPPDADLIAAYSEFAHSLTLPGFLSRATGFQALFAEAGIDVEYRLGSTSASPTSAAHTAAASVLGSDVSCCSKVSVSSASG